MTPEPKIKVSKDKSNQGNRMEILKERGFIAFDTSLTEQEKESISQVNVEKELPQFDYYGPIGDKLLTDLRGYLNELDKNSEEIINNIANLIMRIAGSTVKDFNKESAWVMVRVSLPNHEFDMPRWHTDGGYFKSQDKNYKLVMTVKGAPTRFAEKVDAEKFEQLEKESSENYQLNLDLNPEEFKKEDVRIGKELDSVVKEIQPCKDGQSVYYLIGHDDAIVHSEPPIHESRIFMSVVPGSIEEINELEERWTK